MNPALLRRILLWVSPLIIGYFMKRYEEKHAKKTDANVSSKRIK